MTPGCASAQPLRVGGHKPAYQDKALSEVPNARAMVRRFWAPGLDDGFTPQGLAVSGGRIHVVGYGTGRCRLFSLTPQGEQVSARDIPGCRHGGGLAVLPDGRFVVIDTAALFLIGEGGAPRKIALEPPLVGSFGEADGKDLWIGSYVKRGQGALWRIPLSRLSGASLAAADATGTLVLPARAQGMALGAGGLWLTFSGANAGELARFDPDSGEIRARYAMPAGIEDIGILNGLIWSVSEAGSKKYRGWSTNFPLVFALDPARLE